VLADIVEPGGAGRLGPEPTPAAVVPRALLFGALGHAPEGDGYLVAAAGPAPDGPVLRIPDGAHPVLARGVASARASQEKDVRYPGDDASLPGVAGVILRGTLDLPVPPPQLPGYEALEGGVALVDEGPVAGPTEAQGLAERLGLPIVEDVALAVVGGR
jgi:hypothetical protein